MQHVLGIDDDRALGGNAECEDCKRRLTEGPCPECVSRRWIDGEHDRPSGDGVVFPDIRARGREERAVRRSDRKRHELRAIRDSVERTPAKIEPSPGGLQIAQIHVRRLGIELPTVWSKRDEISGVGHPQHTSACSPRTGSPAA